jgi:predicted solute-binding protein
MLQGPQRGIFDLDFQTPAVCADQVAAGEADIGIVPSFELLRQDLEILRGTGIACHGPVRSILLVSRSPASEIATMAADTSSRTSVQLARVILERRYGASPELIPHPPDLEAMLAKTDAALIIGDPALRVDPARLTHHVYDLGAEWVDMTGLPMVFAVWAGPKSVVTPQVAQAFRDSCRWGREHLEEIVASESQRRGFPPELVREYLARRVVHELDARDYQGMELFLRHAAELGSGAAAQAGHSLHG